MLLLLLVVSAQLLRLPSIPTVVFSEAFCWARSSSSTTLLTVSPGITENHSLFAFPGGCISQSSLSPLCESIGVLSLRSVTRSTLLSVVPSYVFSSFLSAGPYWYSCFLGTNVCVRSALEETWVYLFQAGSASFVVGPDMSCCAFKSENLTSGAIVPLFDLGGASPKVSSHLNLISGPTVTKFITNSSPNFLFQLNTEPSPIHSNLQFEIHSTLLKLWPPLSGIIGATSASCHPCPRATLSNHELVDYRQSLLRSELCNPLISSVDLQGNTTAEIRPVANLLRRVRPWKRDSSLMQSLNLYGIRTNGGSMGKLFPNPSSLSILLMGLFGPYQFQGYWVLEVETIIYGLSYLIISQEYLVIVAHQLLLVYVIGINLTSRPSIHFSIRESPTFSPLFQRAYLPVWVIPVQQFLSPLWRFQSSSYKALRAIVWIRLQSATESSSSLPLSGTLDRTTLELCLVAVIYLFIVFAMVVVVIFPLEDEDEFSLKCNETI